LPGNDYHRRETDAQALPTHGGAWAYPEKSTTFVAPSQVRPALPSMPAMLPEEPIEAEITAAALRAVSAAEAGDAQTQAAGWALRVTVFGGVATIGAGMLWAVLALAFNFNWAALPLLIALAAVATLVYALVSELIGHRFTAAGVERLKVKTARQIHADRLQARQEMHARATEAWENVLTEYLRRDE
jgi:hypothetical protein